MAQVVFGADRVVGDFLNPYIVAELNTSHFGDLELAKQMIDTALAVGCDCVKFQSWTASTLYSANYYRQNPIAERVIQKFSLDEERLLDLALYCRAVGIDFASTPYSIGEATYLVEKCHVPFLKIASMDCITRNI